MTALTLSAGEAIQLLGADLKPETLHEWARDGLIGSVKVGRERRFTTAQIEAYLAKNSSDPTDTGRSRRSRARRPAR